MNVQLFNIFWKVLHNRNLIVIQPDYRSFYDRNIVKLKLCNRFVYFFINDRLAQNFAANI